MEFETEVNAFLASAAEHGLRIIMVGGAAVNHHGYKRHSADVDLWIDRTRRISESCCSCCMTSVTKSMNYLRR